MRLLKLAVALLLGLILGCGAAFVRERMNTSIRRRGDLETALHVPGLGLIPKAVDHTAPVETRRPFSGFLSGQAPANKPVHSAGNLVTLGSGTSAGTEAYRVLRTNLLFSRQDHPLKTIVITSALPGEGKTTTAANLAVSFAREGRRVLLVDCDMWRGRLHRYFGVNKRPGLVQFLAARTASWERANGTRTRVEYEQPSPPAVINATNVQGLFLLANGASAKDQSVLLRGTEMRRLMQEAEQEFDLVLLDTPPVLAVADAAILAAIADGVLLVVRAGATQRAAAQQALRQLSDVGANVLGAVLNDPTGSIQEPGYYAYTASDTVESAMN